MKNSMRRSALVFLFAFACILHDSFAQETRKVSIDGASVGEALRDFLSELRSNLQRDVGIWHDRAQKVRKEIRNKIDNEDESYRRRLLTDEAHHQLLSKGWELFMNLNDGIKSVIDAKKVKVHEFFSDVLGSNWFSSLPASWHDGSFSWDDLGEFDFSTSLTDFLSSDVLTNLQRPQTLSELYDKMDAAVDVFCTKEVIKRSVKKPTACYGPQVNITFVPKSCIIDSINKQVVCDPAKIVLIKSPGFCNLKYYKAFEWQGKECRHKGQIGLEKLKTYGGRELTVDLGEIDYQKIDQLKNDIHNLHNTSPPPGR